MLIILSPAKKLLSFTKPYPGLTTDPLLKDEMTELAKLMKSKSAEQIGKLMNLSKNLACLNYERYQVFNLEKAPLASSYPALELFQGDVYQGLSAKSWTDEDKHYAQKHLCILSGLYGILRPLDRIQPYRLEMGVRLANPKGETLYDYWGQSLTKMLNQQLALNSNPMLINLASREYFKVLDQKNLSFPVLTIHFIEQKNNKAKIIGIHAKKARGLMAKFLIQKRVENLGKIKEFCDLGYRYCEETSSEMLMNFIRVH
ncbi:MAG: peroxide stress protein YaaA [Tatlockia sp.]|nr:peroxide stress protein YaaA [Tatlockia sp.]